MKTIQTSAGKIDLDEIVQALLKLKAPDLKGFTTKLLTAIEQQDFGEYSKREKELIHKIRTGGPSEVLRRRQRELASKSFQGTMTDEENQEALKLVPVFEQWDFERLKMLIELSECWNLSIEGVMQKLNISAPEDVLA